MSFPLTNFAFKVDGKFQRRVRIQQLWHELTRCKHGRISDIRLHAYNHGPSHSCWQYLLSHFSETDRLDIAQDDAQ